MMGVLGGGLSTLSGYNGLPSVLSGLDDSLSDVVPRKKYPFELEKAIHNVMFIQNHMQRQDEFNAVSKKFQNPCATLSFVSIQAGTWKMSYIQDIFTLGLSSHNGQRSDRKTKL